MISTCGPTNFQACVSYGQAVIRSDDHLFAAVFSRVELTYFPVADDPISVPIDRCEMKNPTLLSELHKGVGSPSSETVQSLRLLKAFVRLGPRQRFKAIELVE